MSGRLPRTGRRPGKQSALVPVFFRLQWLWNQLLVGQVTIEPESGAADTGSSSTSVGEGVRLEPIHGGLFVTRHDQQFGQTGFEFAYPGPTVGE